MGFNKILLSSIIMLTLLFNVFLTISFSPVSSSKGGAGNTKFHGVQEALSEIRRGNLAIINSTIFAKLKTIKEFKQLIPYYTTFNLSRNVAYAVGKIDPGVYDSVFIYAEPLRETFKLGDFVKRASQEFTSIRQKYYRSRARTVVQLPANYTWVIRTPTSRQEIKPHSVTSVVSAYLAGTMIWNSYDSWAPYGRVKLVYSIYKLADIDPNNDYYTVVLHTEVYPGYWLSRNDPGSGSKYGSRWELDTAAIYVDTDHYRSNVFTLLRHEPSQNLNYYNDLTPPPITYTIGTGGASISVSFQLKAYKLDVVTVGTDWVKWIFDLNREELHDNGVGRERVVVEPSYTFLVDLNAASTVDKAQQLLKTSIHWVENNPAWFDSHKTTEITIVWEWVFR